MPQQSLQTSLPTAIAESMASAGTLEALAQQHRLQHRDTDQSETIRHWQTDAGTYCYQTHIAISNQRHETLATMADILYNASTMKKQPWYSQFLGGISESLNDPTPQGIQQHQLALGQFDLGLKSPRCYRQLVSMARPDTNTAVIVARSIDRGPAIPAGCRLAHTLAPNGEVLYWEKNCLHWHHICCTPGAAILTANADRWLTNALRALRLDGAERKTYRDEAINMRLWLQDNGPC